MQPIDVGCALDARKFPTAPEGRDAMTATTSTPTATRCQTGWKIRKDRKTTNPNKRWEAYHNDHGPLYRQFPSWHTAFAFVRSCTLSLIDVDAPIPYVATDMDPWTRLR